MRPTYFFPAAVVALMFSILSLGAESTIRLDVGATETLTLKTQADTINVSQAGIVDLFMPSPTRLAITGLKAGVVVLTTVNSDMSVDIRTLVVSDPRLSHLDTIESFLRERLKGIEGVTVSKGKDQVVVSGRVSETDRVLITQMSEIFGSLVDDQATFYDPSERDLEEFLGRALGQIPGLKIGADGDKVVLSGELPEDTRPFLGHVLASFGDQVISRVTFSKALDDEAKGFGAPPKVLKTIQIDVEVVEINLTQSRTMGVNWFPGGTPFELDVSFGSSGNPFNPSAWTYTSAIDVANLKWQIQALAQKGFANILATPKLKVRSGSKATFLAGGEVPIVSTTANASSVEYKEFGTKLDITPTVEADGRISVDVVATVSTLSFSQAVQGNPTILKKTAETFLTLPSGRSFALAGLIERQESVNDSGLPWLQDIPLLGYLFNSEQKSMVEKETLIIITPYIISEEEESRAPERGRVFGSDLMRTGIQSMRGSEISEEALLSPPTEPLTPGGDAQSMFMDTRNDLIREMIDRGYIIADPGLMEEVGMPVAEPDAAPAAPRRMGPFNRTR